jgi:hypothetical protein
MSRFSSGGACFAALFLASASSAECPPGQELRVEKYPASKKVLGRGCAKKSADGRFTREGKWIFFYESGKKKSEGTYEGGKNEGVATWYFESGQKRCSYTFKADKMEGPATEWFENGKKKSEAIYKDDNLVPPPSP